MAEVTVELRSIRGTGAALGWAGQHTVLVDRPDGRAGGTGLGFNGAELLGLALGGCFANDLRYTAETMGVEVERLHLKVRMTLGGEPLVATDAKVEADVALAGGGDPAELIARAKADCTIANSLQRGVRVEIG